MLDDFGGGKMNMVVNVNRLELIEVLKKNLETHKKEYLEAVEEYWAKCETECKKLLKGIKSRTARNVTLMIQAPESHESSYVETIEMLEMSVDETIKMDAANFRRYVKDEWEWKARFLSAKLSYSR